jgi:hypothetical protein
MRLCPKLFINGNLSLGRQAFSQEGASFNTAIVAGSEAHLYRILYWRARYNR